MSISVRFRLRFGQTTGEKPRQLYIYLKIDGAAASAYASGVYVRPDKWHSGYQKVTGYSKLASETNKELENIEAEHKRLLYELERLHQAGLIPLPPVAETIKQYWTRKSTLIPSVMDAYNTYLSYLYSLEGTPEQRDRSTLAKWENGRLYLTEYIESRNAHRLTVDLLTVEWTEGFYHALLKRPLGKASAARFVGHLRASITHLVKTRRVSTNPIADYFPDKGKDKEIYFMDELHLIRLWSVESLDHTHGLARDWLLLMCYTGMDLPDLERYVLLPERYNEVTPDGIMIVIPRGKTDLYACIPLLVEVSQILSLYPQGIPRLTSQSINRWAKVIQRQIGFEENLTTKICRKTAGAIFLQKGFSIEEVSKILGHSSPQTTLRHYLKVTGKMVIAGMKRVNESKLKRL